MTTFEEVVHFAIFAAVDIVDQFGVIVEDLIVVQVLELGADVRVVQVVVWERPFRQGEKLVRGLNSLSIISTVFWLLKLIILANFKQGLDRVPWI